MFLYSVHAFILRKKWLIIDNKKWVFTVQCFHSSGLLVSFFIAKISYRYFLPSFA